MKMTPSCLPRRAGSEHVLVDLERSISKFDPRSSQVMTHVSQYAYLMKRLDDLSPLAPFARLYLHLVAGYWRKNGLQLYLTSP